MSQHVLPHTVRIKRKRQDEPVETLHVHHTPQDDPKKRRFTLDQPASSYPAVFRRVLQQDPAVAGASALDGSTSSLAAAGPTAAPTATTSSDPVSAAATAANDSSAAPSRTDSPSSTPSSSDRKILAPAPATRRFHLSTKSAPSRSSSPGGSLQKRKNVATLVESKPKKTRTAGGPEVAEYVAQKAAAGRDGSGHDVEMQVDHEQPAVSAHQQQHPTTLKRPGRTARSASPAIGRGTNGATTTATATAVAAGNSDTDKSGEGAVDLGLLSEMQKFAQEVEHAEEQREKPAPSTPGKPTPIYPPTLATPPSHQKLKFQPKATPRFRDRHPERFANNNGATTEGMDIDNHRHAESDSDDDDGDYVYDTYVRYDGPPDTVIDNASAATALPPDIGVLVINVDEQPLWEAYLEQNPAAEDSDKEFDTDDEDENAEDFYANEYPEDEVASDDERDEGAYRYRVAASDEEEWGMYSDEEDLGRPWGRRPAWLKSGSGDEGSNSD